MQGILRKTGGGRYDWLVNGELHSEGVDNAADAPFNTPINAEVVDGRLVSWDYAPAPAYNLEDKRIVIAVAVVNSGSPDDRDLEKATSRARELEHWLRLSNRGRWESIECIPFAVENVANSTNGAAFQWHTVRSQLREQRPDDADRITHYHGLGGYKAGTLGEAYVGTPYAWTYNGDIRTTRHEQGHSFGCGHSFSGGYAYGHPGCIMAKARCGFCGAQMDVLEQIPDSLIAEAQPGKSYYLLPIECNPDDARDGEHQALVIPGSGRILATVRKTPEQSILGTGDGDEIWIDQASGFNGVEYIGRLRPGRAKNVSGHKIVHGGVKGGVMRVDFDGGDLTDWPRIEPDAGDAITESLSGIWHDPRFPHQGFDLTAHDGRLTGYWFGHHPKGKHRTGNTGRHSGRRWLVLNGEDKGRYIEFEARSVINGEPRYEGAGTIRFDGSTAILRWETGLYGREHYNLSRLTLPKQRTELYDMGDNSGISVAEYEGDTVIYWFGPGQGGQNWRVMHGKPHALQVFEVEQRHRSTHDGEVTKKGTAQLLTDRLIMNGQEYPMERIL